MEAIGYSTLIPNDSQTCDGRLHGQSEINEVGTANPEIKKVRLQCQPCLSFFTSESGGKSASRTKSSQAVRDSPATTRSEEHTSELQSLRHLVCRLLLEKKSDHKRPTTVPADASEMDTSAETKQQR